MWLVHVCGDYEIILALLSGIGLKPWFFLINLIDEKSSADADVQAMAMSLINKVCGCGCGCGCGYGSDPQRDVSGNMCVLATPCVRYGICVLCELYHSMQWCHICTGYVHNKH